jgi:hypothetical protein
MARELVTVARFDIPANAHIARNALEEAGIKAVIQDEQLVAMDYLLSLAVGGIKVQVWEEDAERAIAVLKSLRPAAGETPDESARPGEPEPVTSPQLVDNARDQYARRAMWATLCSVLVAPVAFYTAYLLLMVAFSEGKVARAHWWGVLIATLLAPIAMFLSPLWVLTMLRAVHGVW